MAQDDVGERLVRAEMRIADLQVKLAAVNAHINGLILVIVTLTVVMFWLELPH
jgi:hypothetical protein